MAAEPVANGDDTNHKTRRQDAPFKPPISGSLAEMPLGWEPRDADYLHENSDAFYARGNSSTTVWE